MGVQIIVNALQRDVYELWNCMFIMSFGINRIPTDESNMPLVVGAIKVKPRYFTVGGFMLKSESCYPRNEVSESECLDCPGGMLLDVIPLGYVWIEGNGRIF